MRFNKKFILLGFSASQSFIFLTDFLINRSFSLLSYINISFYLAFLLLLLSLTISTIKSGFFDTVVSSFKRVKKLNEKSFEDNHFDSERQYSEVISFSHYPLLMIGILNALMCGMALIVYFTSK